MAGGYQNIVDDICTALNGVSASYTTENSQPITLTVENVIKQYKRLTDKNKFDRRYRKDGNSKKVVNVAIVSRSGWDNEDDSFCQKVDVGWTYQIHFFYSFIDTGSRLTEEEFNVLIDAILKEFSKDTPTDTNIISWGKPKAPDGISYRDFGGVYCHYANISLNVIERISL